MHLLYSVDSYRLIVTKTEEFFVIEGWLYAPDQVFFAAAVNGREAPIHIQRLPRYDVQEALCGQETARDEQGQIPLMTGLRIFIGTNSARRLRELKLFACGGNEKETILALNKKTIRESVSEKTLMTEIERTDVFVRDGQSYFVVRGWAVSYCRNVHINAAVHTGGEPAACWMYRFVRNDVCEMKRLAEEDGKCGFCVVWPADQNSYKLALSDGNEIHQFKLEKDAVKHRDGKDFDYMNWYMAHRPAPRELAFQREVRFEYAPMISVVVPVFNTPDTYLADMIRSVKLQTYPNWELCIADGSGDNEAPKRVIDGFAEEDQRIRYVKLSDNRGIAGNTNAALGIATGEYIAFLDHDDILASDALFETVSAMQTKRIDMLYSDEDKVNQELNHYMEAFFKPDFNVDLLRSMNYITHFLVVDKKIVDAAGGFRSEFDGSQDYDFILRCSERAKAIHHIPRILYHWRIHTASAAQTPGNKGYAYEAGCRALEEHYCRCGVKAKVRIHSPGIYHTVYCLDEMPLVSVIIGGSGSAEEYDRCRSSLQKPGAYEALEVIAGDAGSSRRQEAYNEAATAARGEYLLFLDCHVEAADTEAVRELVSIAARDDIGAAGGGILLKDGSIIDAGMIIGIGGTAASVHFFRGGGSQNRILIDSCSCDYSAVSADCMIVKADLFRKVGGFSTEYEAGLYDADFCLRIGSLGYRIVYNAFSGWSGYFAEADPAKGSQAVLYTDKDAEVFRSRFSDFIKRGDPYYNPGLSRERDAYQMD